MPKSLPAARVLGPPEPTVVDLLDHLLNKGVMATGDLTLGVAGIDLIYVRLSALLCAADRILPDSARRSRRSAERAGGRNAQREGGKRARRK